MLKPSWSCACILHVATALPVGLGCSNPVGLEPVFCNTSDPTADGMCSKCGLGTPGHEEGVENESGDEWEKGLIGNTFIDDGLTGKVTAYGLVGDGEKIVCYEMEGKEETRRCGKCASGLMSGLPPMHLLASLLHQPQ